VGKAFPVPVVKTKREGIGVVGGGRNEIACLHEGVRKGQRSKWKIRHGTLIQVGAGKELSGKRHLLLGGRSTLYNVWKQTDGPSSNAKPFGEGD